MFESLKYNLKHNRRHVMRYATAWFLFGAIIVVFIFWGMSPKSQNQGLTHEGGSAAVVNDTTISLAQFADLKERMRRDPRFAQLQEMGGDAGRQMLDQQAISELVNMELIRQAVERQNMFTSNAEVLEAISSYAAFQEEGRFKASIYKARLAQERKSPAQFEDEIRNEKAVNRMFKIFAAGLKPLKIEGEKLKALSAIKANIEYVTVATDSLINPDSIAAADLKAFLVQPAVEGKIKDYFESHKKEFSTQERVKVRHILVRAKPGDADDEKKAHAKAIDIAKQAKTGDFAKLATKLSDDTGSKSSGGLIDFFSRGKMVPAFEAAAFSQPLNVVGEPVKTEYGYHIILVLDKKPAANPVVDEVKEEIARTLLAKDRSKVAIEGLQEALKKSDMSLVQKFVAENKLKWEESGPFSIESDNVPKLGSNDELVKIAFRLTADKPLAESLVREGGRSLIVRYKAVPAEKEVKKTDQSDLMAEMMAGRRAQDIFQKWVEDLRKNSKISINPEMFGRNRDS